MSESINQEMWQVEVGGQVYDADFGELAAWVADGALQPEDKVRRGNLRWIEAHRVPTLVPHFNAKRDGTPPPLVVVTVTDAPSNVTQAAVLVGTSHPLALASTHIDYAAADPVVQTLAVQAITPPRQLSTDACGVHPDTATAFLCNGCGGSFCKACPTSYGGSVRICPACGGMCKPKDQVQATRAKEHIFVAAANQGFGFDDFGHAIAYPFKFKTSLFFGSVMFMFFSLGESASSFGGIAMVAASLFCVMLANMLTFGVLAHTVDEFSQGKIGGNFMPRYDDFSIWDDVVHPFFLSIGAYISSFGAFLVIAGIGTYIVISSLAADQKAMMSEIEKLPGTPYYNTQKTMQQSQEANKILGDVKRQNDERLQQQADVANGTQTAPTGAPDTEDGVMRANEMIQKAQKSQLESALGKTPETRENEKAEFVKRFLNLAAPLVVLAAIAFLWGLFYFPAACTVAGYTKSFTAAINPLVGLDTIKRLGFDYVKLLFMGLLILIGWVIIGGILGVIFSAFNMPGVGNVPAKAVGSLFGFYFSVVFSCLIGFILFKSAERLKLHR
jgi:hypothetical protein